MANITIARNGAIFVSSHTSTERIASLIERGSHVFIYDEDGEWRQAILDDDGVILRNPLPDPAHLDGRFNLQNGVFFLSGRTPDARIATILKGGYIVFVYNDENEEWRIATLSILRKVLRNPLPANAFFNENGLAVH